MMQIKIFKLILLKKQIYEMHTGNYKFIHTSIYITGKLFYFSLGN